MSGRWDEEDWSMQLAAEGAVDQSMHDLNTAMDLNAGASAAQRAQREKQLEERRDRLENEADKRAKTESLDELRKKNLKALEAWKKKEASTLPEGWKKVESRSRPGTYVYENIYTEERQAWRPDEPASKPVAAEPAKEEAAEAAAAPAKGAKKGVSDELKERNRKALEARKKKAQQFLPEGWRKVESNSRRGEYVYENEYTGERIAWFPQEPARKEAMPEQAIEPKDGAEKHVVLYPYAALAPEELDLKQGDVLIVEHKSPNGWNVATNLRSGKMGLYPNDFSAVVE